MSFIIDLILDFLFSFLLLPIYAVLATPWIIIRNIFRKGGYIKNIKTSYTKVFEYWKKHP